MPGLQDGSLDIDFTSDRSHNDAEFSLIESTKRLRVWVTKKLDQEKLASIEKTATTISALNTYMGGAADATSLGLSLMNID